MDLPKHFCAVRFVPDIFLAERIAFSPVDALYDAAGACAVETDEPRYQLPDRSVISSSCGKTVSANSVNSFPSENGAYKSYDVDSDGRSVRTSDVGAAEVGGVARQPPHHAPDPVDGYSLKSYSTTSQLSAAAEQYEYASLSCYIHAGRVLILS